MQKRAAAGAGVPQLAQVRWSGDPQPMQKRASPGFSIPHEAQARALIG
jgi:hypothetical protein